MVRLAKEAIASGRSNVPGREQELRNFLGTFNFGGEMVRQTVGTMSGGEKARLVLCMIVWQRPNLLLLDEPTNHLDISSKEVLEEALRSFEGTILFISHDRYFINKIATRVIEVQKDQCLSYNGNYDDYLNQKTPEVRSVFQHFNFLSCYVEVYTFSFRSITHVIFVVMRRK